MKIIGLTGGTGSGKSLASLWLQKQNAYIIDTDKIAHDIILKGNPAYEELIAFFGVEILDKKGEIIRRSLGDIVFHDAEKLAFLNRATHKHIRKTIFDEIQKAKQQNSPCAILDAPLLIEADLMQICDEVWVVAAKEEIRIKRIMERDGILVNDQNIPFLEQQIETIFKEKIGE